MAARAFVFAISAICLLLVEIPREAEARSVSLRVPRSPPPTSCEVCHGTAATHQPIIRMTKFSNNTVCLTNSFSKNDFSGEPCDGSNFNRLPTEETFRLSKDIPSCVICHNDASKVTSMQKVWTKDGKIQCAEASFAT